MKTESSDDRTWQGGRFYDTAKGRVYAIERRVDGEVRSISLRPGLAPQDALAELALFNRDRAEFYQRHKGREEGPVGFNLYLDEYLESLDGLSAKHQHDTKSYLEKWAVLLKKTNLRRLTAKDLRDHLPPKIARKKMIASIKGYLSWLHENFKLTNNPGETLHAPAATRSKRPKGYPIKFIEETYATINPKPRSVPLKVGGHPVDELTSQAVRDVFALAAMHGMHFTEVERLVKEGELHELNPPQDALGGYAVFTHKNKDEHRQALTVQTFAAAKRLQARGSAPVESCVREHLERAAKAMGLKSTERLRLSQLRHSFFTNGQANGTRLVAPAGQGVSMAELAASAGHKQLATSFKHYDFTPIPTLILLPYRLVHASDPLPD